MIKELLLYQEKDKERLALVLGVENGRIKRELDAAVKAKDEAKNLILMLEEEAKALTQMFETISQTSAEFLNKIEQYHKDSDKKKNEEEIQSAAVYGSALLTKVAGYENQLDDIAKRISAKAAAFEDAKLAHVKALNMINARTPEYERQLKEIEPKITAFEDELKKISLNINKELLEKYKQKRKNDKSDKITDVAVEIAGNRCGACLFEMPLSLLHRINTDGYIICEECGKIIYKNA